MRFVWLCLALSLAVQSQSRMTRKTTLICCNKRCHGALTRFIAYSVVCLWHWLIGLRRVCRARLAVFAEGDWRNPRIKRRKVLL